MPLTGSCLCGAIRFTAHGKAAKPAACHCGQCRKTSGHIWASSHVPDDQLEISGDVTWYQSSDKARRGFCSTCGASMFWKHDDDDHISFALGTVDGPTGLTLTRQIFTEDKGDYYDLPPAR